MLTLLINMLVYIIYIYIIYKLQYYLIKCSVKYINKLRQYNINIYKNLWKVFILWI